MKEIWPSVPVATDEDLIENHPPLLPGESPDRVVVVRVEDPVRRLKPGPRSLVFFLRKRPRVSRKILAEQLNVSLETIRVWLGQLRKAGIVDWKRTGKASVYEVVKAENLPSDGRKSAMDPMHCTAKYNIAASRREEDSEVRGASEEAEGRFEESIATKPPAKPSVLLGRAFANLYFATTNKRFYLSKKVNSQFKALSERHKDEELARALSSYFSDEYAKASGFPVDLFVSQVNALKAR